MTVKERIRKYIEYKSISRYRFYKDIDVANGYLDKPGSPTSDVIASILLKYQDLNIFWLLTGNEEMLISDSSSNGDGSLNNSGNMNVIGNTHIGSGNSINVSLPEKGTQKIIKPDGTVEIIANIPESVSGTSTVDSSKYQLEIKSLQDKLESMNDLVKSLRDTIKAKDETIEILRDRK